MRIFMISPSERSGSTWISHVLASHPGVSLKTEPFRLHLPSSNILHPLNSEQCVLSSLKELLANEETPFARYWWRCFLDMYQQEDGNSVIKETNLFFKTQACNAILGNLTRRVLLTRDVRGVVASFKKSKLFEKWDYNFVWANIVYCIKSNAHIFKEYGDLLDSMETAEEAEVLAFLYCLNLNEIAKCDITTPFFMIEYEKVVENPTIQARELLAYCQLPPSSEVSRFIESSTVESSGIGEMSIRKKQDTNYWQQVITLREESVIQSIVAKAVEFLPTLASFVQNRGFVFFRSNTSHNPPSIYIETDGRRDKTEKSLHPLKCKKRADLILETEEALIPVNTSCYASKYLVTNFQYTQFLNWLLEMGIDNVREDHYVFLNEAPGVGRGSRIVRLSQNLFGVVKGYEQHPVMWIPYIGAYFFAQFLGGRLLKEAEYIDLSASEDDWFNLKGNTDHTIGETSSVHSYAPNIRGFYDFHGNVYSWTETNNETERHLGVALGGAWSRPSHPIEKRLIKPKMFGSRSIGLRLGSSDAKLHPDEDRVFIEKLHCFFQSL